MNAIITGTGRPNGIGANIAYALARRNINVFLTSSEEYDIKYGILKDVNSMQYSEIIEKCKKYGVKAAFRYYDLSNAANINKLFDEANNTLGSIDILVTSQCYHIFDSFGSISEELFDSNLSVNTKATFLLCQEFYRRFNGEFGRIINVSSTQALEPLTTEVSYAVTKAAVPIIVSTLAPIMAKKHITINAVNPGPTDVGDSNVDEYSDLQNYQSMNLFGRLGIPEDIANLVCFLISEKGGWITGQTINSEGGLFRKSSNFW